jgi:hypothetical protein
MRDKEIERDKHTQAQPTKEEEEEGLKRGNCKCYVFVVTGPLQPATCNLLLLMYQVPATSYQLQ